MKCDFLAQKKGMTRVWRDDQFIAVTVLEFLDTKVIEKVNDKKIKVLVKGPFSKLNKPQLKVAGIENTEKARIKEVKFYKEVNGDLNISDIIESGEYVDIQAKNKGHGFTGVMKRWNFSGGRASHGASLSHRSGGSTGCRQDPGKTYKNRKMAGHMGHETTTQQNLKIIDIIPEHNLILVKGSIPGPKKSVVLVKQAIKKGKK